MDEPQSIGRRRFDMTVNVQSLVMSMFGAAFGAIVMWYSLVGRVQTLEDHDKQQEAHFSQIEAALAQQRSDVKESLRDIGASVKETNGKIDYLTQQLYLNTAGNRPDTKRWSR
ncbi:MULTISPECIES: hypothetical protein [Burkholderia]|uniref:hypothetical protein n=1 Tax=Burkholderia TaxID=32008 RepID=UPI00163E9205|nr:MULTISPECIES: hypothetical protein [Burkholderia]MBU9173969.1 hypothetical protein [Burkholderia gladioli]MCM2537727.1 hypothetical protein [Burkholderia glumae]